MPHLITGSGHSFQRLIGDGVVADKAQLARPGHVSQTRLTQITNLLWLAPDIQEQILLLPKTQRELPPIASQSFTFQDIAFFGANKCRCQCTQCGRASDSKL